MDFFHSLTLDLKILVIGIAGFMLLALFSGNPKSEKRYLAVLVVLAAAGVYRFSQLANEDRAQQSAQAPSVQRAATTPPPRIPLISTSAK